MRRSKGFRAVIRPLKGLLVKSVVDRGLEYEDAIDEPEQSILDSTAAHS